MNTFNGYRYLTNVKYIKGEDHWIFKAFIKWGNLRRAARGGGVESGIGKETNENQVQLAIN